MRWFAEFFGFGPSYRDVDSQIIAELGEENEELRRQFERIRNSGLPANDGGWGFASPGPDAEPAEIAKNVVRMCLDWQVQTGYAEKYYTVADERDALVEQNDRLMQEIGRLQAEIALPVELQKGFVPQLAIEARKPRVFDDWRDIPKGVIAADSDGDRFRVDDGTLVWSWISEESGDWYEWATWFDRDQGYGPDGPFTEVLPRIFNRGDVIPDDVTKLRLAGETNAVERTEGGGFAYNPDLLSEGWGPSDTSDAGWEDSDFPLAEVLN